MAKNTAIYIPPVLVYYGIKPFNTSQIGQKQVMNTQFW